LKNAIFHPFFSSNYSVFLEWQLQDPFWRLEMHSGNYIQYIIILDTVNPITIFPSIKLYLKNQYIRACRELKKQREVRRGYTRGKQIQETKLEQYGSFFAPNVSGFR
jgi:hypothetical protein